LDKAASLARRPFCYPPLRCSPAPLMGGGGQPLRKGRGGFKIKVIAPRLKYKTSFSVFGICVPLTLIF